MGWEASEEVQQFTLLSAFFAKRPGKSLFFCVVFFLFLSHFFLSKRASSKWRETQFLGKLSANFKQKKLSLD